jgi:ATP-dependent RNA helicase DeaD
MTEMPKDAARIVATERPDPRVDAFVERYLRRARRIDEREVVEGAEPFAIQYLTVSLASRAAALRRLLDEIDPPSAAIIAESDDDAAIISNLLRALGYAGEETVQLSRGAVEPNSHAVIFFGMPASRAQLAAAAGATPVTMIAMVQPRDVPALRRMAGGDVKPLTLPDAGKTARDRERALRAELEGVLGSGVPAREILALEPLLDKHDGIEIAAAALRLLERERAARKSDADAVRISRPRHDEVPVARRGPPDRGGRPADGRRGAPGRDRRPTDARGGPPERGGRSGDPRRGPAGPRPPRGRS